ncbi:MAG: hypothetical protein K0S65_1359 [Labilithrix sp.]|nr:hypothetical protein [Labilithrix sp.]
MHFTRRRLERSAGALLVASSFSAASCSTSEADTRPNVVDAAAEASNEAFIDASKTDDAGASLVDAGPLPIVCASAPCATSLVTTLGADANDRSEGFCALLSDGTVACWGANNAGQLGRGDDAGTVESANALRVLGLSDVVMLDHTCAVDKGGGVWCWGTGPFLQQDAGTVTTVRAPVKLDLPPATSVGLGHAVACAAVSDGVLCWGSNADAQLSPLTIESTNAGLPTRISIPAGAPMRALVVGRATFVLREDGSLLTWGANPPAGRVSPLFPDPHPQSIALGGLVMADLVHDNACAVASGRGYCWGAPVVQYGGSPFERALPQPVVIPEPVAQIATTRNYVQNDVVVDHSRWCASAVSGAVYCWGQNDSGQAGDGSQDYAADAVRVNGLPERAAQVRTTASTTCALLTNGMVYCWGNNHSGQLGNGQSRGKSGVPVKVVLP